MSNRNAVIAIAFLIAFSTVGYLLANSLDRNSELTQNPQPMPQPIPVNPTPVTPPTSPPVNPLTPPPVGGSNPNPAPPSSADLKPEISWGDTTKNQIIFTFDGGSGINSADEILEALKDHGVKGTFFVTGKFASDNPDLIKRIDSEGHEIFNHTYTHADLTTVPAEKIRDELGRAEVEIKTLTGKSTKPYFRPPYGARNLEVRKVAADEGYQSIYWTVDALDWKEDEGWTDAATRTRIMNNLKPGTIYMMHIGDNITGRILDDIFTEIESKGFKIVSLSEGL